MKETAALRRRILSRRATVAVVGQGHSGLSLSCAAADAGFRVTALDLEETRISELRRGVLSVPGVSELAFRAGLASRRIEFSSDLDSIQDTDVVSICVTVPNHDQAPELAVLEGVCRQIGQHLHPGHLVILESAAHIGTTDELARPALESSGLSASNDFLLAHAPERIDPGNEEYGIRNTTRIVGGMTREATGVAALFLGQFVDKVIQVSSCRVAEMTKLLEDTFRHVNVGLVNELAVFCNAHGVDVWEVLEAAASKPFGYMQFLPGSGVGGYGIPSVLAPVDRDHVDGRSGTLRIVEQAREANSLMPQYVASRIEHTLKEKGRDMRSARIFVLGVTYKPNIGDTSDSPALKVMDQLKHIGAKVSYHDPYVPELMLNGDVLSRSQLTERSVKAADCVAILTPHQAYDLDWIAGHASLVFDAGNAYGPDRRPNVVRL